MQAREAKLMSARPARAFTLIELLVAISIIALLVGILLPVLSHARTAAQKAENLSQLRGIHQGMLAFAEGNGGFYPGLDGEGAVAISATSGDERVGAPSGTTANAFAFLVNGRYITRELLISPGEDLEVAQFGLNQELRPGAPESKDRANFSYAALAYAFYRPSTNQNYTPAGPGQRVYNEITREWQANANSKAVVLGDRNTGDNAEDPSTGISSVSSIWTGEDAGRWEGGVVRNDNSVSLASSHIAENTRYGSLDFDSDNLFKYSNDFASLIMEIKASDCILTVNDGDGYANQGDTADNGDGIAINPPDDGGGRR